MTLTRDWRRGLAITFAVLATLSVMVVGNQRHAQAHIADEILCDVEEGLNSEGLPFDFEQDECGEEDGDGETPIPTEDPECSDGIDNDNDGKTDWQPPVVGSGDPGCSTPTDDDESDDPSNGGGGDENACEDGQDNDGDGKVDMDDPGCTDSSDDDETDSSGGGGGSDNACEDGQDNDGDGKVDMDDPGCTDSSDDDETDPSGGSGGNGDSSSGGSGGGGSKRSNGEVLGDATCSEYLTAYLRMGRENDAEQVRRLQFVLKEMEGFEVEINGVFDAATLAAVNAFQVRYADDILTPWGISTPTGYTYITTRKKVNEVYCKGEVAFQLTEVEQQIIEKSKTRSSTQSSAATSVSAPVAQTTTIDATEATAAVANASSTPSERRGFWGSIRDFFRGVFGRD